MARGPLIAILCLVLSVTASAGPVGPVLQGDPQAAAEVQAAFQKFASAHTWRARISSSGGGTQADAQMMDHVAPDKFRMTLSQGGQTSEMFLLGHDTWVRAEGVCQKLPAAIPMVNPREAMEHGTDTRITVTRGGPETVEGTSTKTYMMTVETQGRQLRQKLYVATGTGLPRRIEFASDGGTTVIDYFDFDAPITIKNPPC